jgi:hypothetical protein
VGVRAAARVAGLRSAKPRCRPECAVCDTLLGCISERGGLIADELSGVDGRGFVDSSCLGVGGISMAKVAGLGIFLVDAGAAAVGMEEGGWVGRASSLVCSGAGSFTLGVGATLADFFRGQFFRGRDRGRRRRRKLLHLLLQDGSELRRGIGGLDRRRPGQSRRPSAHGRHFGVSLSVMLFRC